MNKRVDLPLATAGNTITTTYKYSGNVTEILYSKDNLNFLNGAGTNGNPTSKLTVPIPAEFFKRLGNNIRLIIGGFADDNAGGQLLVSMYPNGSPGDNMDIVSTSFTTVGGGGDYITDISIQRTNSEGNPNVDQEIVAMGTTIMGGTKVADTACNVNSNEFPANSLDGVMVLDFKLGATNANHIAIYKILVIAERVAE